MATNLKKPLIQDKDRLVLETFFRQRQPVEFSRTLNVRGRFTVRWSVHVGPYVIVRYADDDGFQTFNVTNGERCYTPCTTSVIRGTNPLSFMDMQQSFKCVAQLSDSDEEILPNNASVYVGGQDRYHFGTLEHSDEEADFTACSSSDCGMCGRCDY